MKNRKTNGNSSKAIKKWAVTGLKLVVTALFWLTLWQIAAMAVGKEILLPSPKVTLLHLAALFGRWDFIKACGVSLLRIMSGFAAGCVVGVALAVLCHMVKFLNTLFTPIRAAVKAAPVASFIIIAYMWLTKSEIPGVIASLIVIPLVWSNVKKGLEEVDPRLIEVGRVFRFSPFYYVKYIYFPSIKPYFISAVVTGTGLAWKSGIAAEVLVVSRDGIGGMLHQSKIDYESADVFAITAVVIVISLLIEAVFERLAKKPPQAKKG